MELSGQLHAPVALVSRLRMLGSINPLPQYVFTAWCLIKHWNNFALPEYTTYSPKRKCLLMLLILQVVL